MEVLLQIAQQRRHLLGRRRHKGGVPETCAADPILAAPNLAGLFVWAAHATHQPAMRLVEQTHREWQPLGTRELAARVLERVEVVADLTYILDWLALVAFSLVLEEIDERRLRTKA